jgi:RND family efflux transporter MFP subunit
MTKFLSIVVLTLAVAACGTHTTPKKDIDPTAATKPAVAQAPAAPIEYVAIVTAKRSKVLPAAFTGPVEEIDVHQSQYVHKDQVIAKMNTKELQSKLKQAKMQEKSAMASAGRSGAQASVAMHQAKMAQKLFEHGAGARAAIIEKQGEVAADGAGAGADAARAGEAAASAEDIQDKIDHAEIKAPFDGEISNVRVKDGDSVQSGMAIARIFDRSDLIIRFAVPTSDKTPIKDGTRIELKFADQDRPIWAEVTEITDEVEPPISYRIVTADIDDSKLRPGELTLGTIGRVTIASAAKPTTKGNHQ